MLWSVGCASASREPGTLPAVQSATQPVTAPESPTPSEAPTSVTASPELQDDYERVPRSTGYEHEPQDLDSWPRHRAQLYLGDNQSRDGAAFTAGLRYGYYLFGNVGLGLIGEYSDRDEETWVLAAAVFARPTKHFQITAAPGLQFVDGSNEPMVRAGFEYEFELSERLALVPSISFDVVSNRPNATNFGVALQASF